MKTTIEEKRPITIRIPRSVRIALRTRAAQEDRRIESVVADAVQDYLARPLPCEQRTA